MSAAVKRYFHYIRRYTSPNENFEYGCPHSNALLQFCLKFEHCKPHKAARHRKKCDVINDGKLLATVYHRIYCRKFLTLSNQTSLYKIKCIRNHCCCFNCVCMVLCGPGLVWSWFCVVLALCGPGFVCVLVLCGPGLVWSWSCVVLVLCGPGLVWSWSCVVLVLCGPGLVWSWSCVVLVLWYRFLCPF